MGTTNEVMQIGKYVVTERISSNKRIAAVSFMITKTGGEDPRVLYTARQCLGLTCEELGKLLGVTADAVSAWESELEPTRILATNVVLLIAFLDLAIRGVVFARLNYRDPQYPWNFEVTRVDALGGEPLREFAEAMGVDD